MSDQIAIELGLPPWRPADDADLVRTYNFYDVPLIGIIRQGGMEHLFACLEGHVEPMSIWAYTRLDEEGIAELERSSDLRSSVMALLGTGPVVVALARDGAIVAAELVRDPEAYAHLVDAALATNQALADQLSDLLEA